MEYIGLLQTDKEKNIDNTPIETYHKQVLTLKYDIVMHRIVSSVDVCSCVNEAPIHRINNAIWDTGATTSVISERLARDMRLHPADIGIAVTPSGSIETPYYFLDVYLTKDIVIPHVKVCGMPLEQNGAEFLIGMDIISKGNLNICNEHSRTVFEFRLNQPICGGDWPWIISK